MTFRSALAALLLLAGPAFADQPVKTADEIKALVAERYGVEVLRVVETAPEDRPAAYRVTVMLPGQAGNAAFLVNTLLVDAATGRLLSAFRHEAAGYNLPDAPQLDPNRSTNNPAAARGHTWR